MEKCPVLLAMNNVTKSFNDNIILKDINLNFDSGKIYGLLGPNGVGKTTLMKTIVGLNVIDRGSIVFHTIDITNGNHEQMRSQIGSLIEYPIFPPTYTVKQVLSEQLFLMNIKIDQAYLIKIIDLLDLTSQSNIKVKNLSLGWKQRLGIARAVANYPKLLLLDEPFNGLDLIAVQKVTKLIQYLAKQGVCIIISSHNLEELANIADQLLLIKHSQIKLISQKQIDNNIKNYYYHQFSDWETKH